MAAVHFSEPVALHTGRGPDDPREGSMVERSAPLSCLVRKKTDSPRSPPCVPTIPEVEEEDLHSLTGFRYLIALSPVPDSILFSSSKEERLSFIQKLRRSSLTFRESLRRRLSSPSVEELGRSREWGRRDSSPPRTVARRQSAIGVVIESEWRARRKSRDWKRSSEDHGLYLCCPGDRITPESSSKEQTRRASVGTGVATAG